MNWFGWLISNGKTNKEEKDMCARIETFGGRFGIVDVNTGEAVATYSRKRDAARGAERRGFTVLG